MSKYIEMFDNIICLDDIYRVFVKHNPHDIDGDHYLCVIYKDKEEITFKSYSKDTVVEEYKKLKDALIENNELCNDIISESTDNKNKQKIGFVDESSCESEAKRIINTIKQGELPPIFDADDQQTYGLELRPNKRPRKDKNNYNFVNLLSKYIRRLGD